MNLETKKNYAVGDVVEIVDCGDPTSPWNSKILTQGDRGYVTSLGEGYGLMVRIPGKECTAFSSGDWYVYPEGMWDNPNHSIIVRKIEVKPFKVGQRVRVKSNSSSPHRDKEGTIRAIADDHLPYPFCVSIDGKSGYAILAARELEPVATVTDKNNEVYFTREVKLQGSSVLSRALYDPESEVLAVEFNNGSVAAYKGVGGAEFGRLAAATSAGSYYNTYIKYHYKGVNSDGLVLSVRERPTHKFKVGDVVTDCFGLVLYRITGKLDGGRYKAIALLHRAVPTHDYGIREDSISEELDLVRVTRVKFETEEV